MSQRTDSAGRPEPDAALAHSRRWVPLVAIPVVIALCGAIPRWVIATFGLDGHWTPFFYQYLLGGLVFAIGLWIIRASGACDFRRPGERKWFWLLIFGYGWYAALHAALFYLADAVPFRGA